MKRIRADAKPLIKALSKAGVVVSSVWDLVNTSQPYEKAIPVLIEHLEKEYHPKTLEGIARALAVLDTNKVEGAWDVILALYKKTTPDESIDEPEFRGIQGWLGCCSFCLM